MKIDDANDTWSYLSEKLELFITSWDENKLAPELSDFLPQEPADLRRMLLVELIKVDLEYRWQHNQQKRIEQYVEEYCELAELNGVPVDLIYEEYHVRRTGGESVRPGEYAERFPEQATEIARLLPVDSITESTCLFVKKETGEVEVGQTIDDFDLLCRLGAGAFATVYLARQISMQRMVALKVSGDKGTEPQTLAQLDHPNIVRVYDQRQLRDRGLRLLYMQYVPGGTLQDVVRHLSDVPVKARSGASMLEAIDESLAKRGESPSADSRWRVLLKSASWPEVVCRMGAQLADALHYAQQWNILHRDVKPANVLMAADATPKLADFNISYNSEVEGASPAAYFGGSLAYMSPEQLDACNPAKSTTPDVLDGRADLFSLAVVLWELLHGERPFRDDRLEAGWAATLEAMAESRWDGVKAPDDRKMANPLLKDLQQVLITCMAPDRDDRWADGAELARRLQLCLHPRARNLLYPPDHSWRRWVRKFPFTLSTIAVLFPHLLASVFNIAYNQEKIVKVYVPREEFNDFVVSTTAVNLVIYPVGLAICGFLAWPVLIRVRLLQKGKQPPGEVETQVRHRAIHLGRYVSWLGISAWLVAAPVIPLSLHFLVEANDIPAVVHLHFLASFAVCGLMVSAYPFFHTALLSVGVFYPAFIERQISTREDQKQLSRLGRLAGIYLVLAGCVPMMSIPFLLLMAGAQSTVATFDLAVLIFLSGVGAIGLAVSFVLYRALQRDLAALAVLARPSEMGSFASEESPF